MYFHLNTGYDCTPITTTELSSCDEHHMAYKPNILASLQKKLTYSQMVSHDLLVQHFWSISLTSPTPFVYLHVYIQLIHELHEFKLCRSNSMWVFFNKYYTELQDLQLLNLQMWNYGHGGLTVKFIQVLSAWRLYTPNPHTVQGSTLFCLPISLGDHYL